MKSANLYYNWKLMAMATNLYYHCWFVGAKLQKTHLFWLLLMLFFLFVSPPFFVVPVLLFQAPHTHNSRHTNHSDSYTSIQRYCQYSHPLNNVWKKQQSYKHWESLVHRTCSRCVPISRHWDAPLCHRYNHRTYA